MSDTAIEFAFAGLTVAWLFVMWSLLRSWSLARRAAQHLSRPESDNYLRNLLLFPRGAWVEPLLKGKGVEDHAAAVMHVRRLHIAMLFCFAGCILLVVISVLIRKFS